MLLRGVSLLWLLCVLISAVPAWAASEGAPSERQRPLVAWDHDWIVTPDAPGAAARAVHLPHTWDDDPALRAAGAAWYDNHFTLPPNSGAAGVLLSLASPVGAFTVLLDGEEVNEAWGNGLPRQVRLTRLTEGRHLLSLRCANTLPPALLRFASPGLGGTTLQVLPTVCLDSVVLLPDVARNTLTVRYHCRAELAGPATLRVDCYAPEGHHVAHQLAPVLLSTGGADGEITLALHRVERWSPEQPRLYRVHAQLTRPGTSGDSFESTCGFVEVALQEQRLALNGVPVVLRGLRLTGGMPALSGSLAEEMARVRDAGYNAIMADGPALPEELLTLADRTGLLVLGDVPAGAAVTHVADLATCIDEEAHHPALIAWSWPGTATAQADVEYARALDPARPLLIREGEQSRWYAPGQAKGIACTELDIAGTLPMPRAWEETLDGLEKTATPLLVSDIDIAASPEAGPAWSREDRTYEELRLVVERARLVQAPLGYFVHAPHAAYTGLTTPGGAPSRLYTAAQIFNQPWLLSLRAHPLAVRGEPLALEARLINDLGARAGVFHLYGTIVSPQGRAMLRAPVLVPLTGERVQNITSYLTVTADQIGEYRLQFLLASNAATYPSARVSVRVEEK